MALPKPEKIQVRFVPNPTIGYEHTHVFKVSRLDDEFAVAGFAMDIPAVADATRGRGAENEGEQSQIVAVAMFRGGFVMAKKAFRRLAVNILTLAIKSDIDVDLLVSDARAAVGGAEVMDLEDRGLS